MERQLALTAEQLTDLQRAARFWDVKRLAFGGNVAGRSFGVLPGLGARCNVLRLERDLAELHDRLAGVVFEQLPYVELISRYDGPETLFYLDPPSWGCEGDFGAGVFGREDFQRLADQLAHIAGRLILSINDRPGAREVFG